MQETKSPRNPYVNRSMIKNPGEFVGRKRELKSIFDRIAKMQCSSVVGERRIGKSSLLYYIHRTYEKELGCEYRVIYLDLQRAKMHTISGFLSEILEKFSADSGGITDKASPLKNLCFFEESVEKLNEKVKPVVCLDEFENIARRTDEFTDDFFESLRSLANSSKIAYVTASKNSLYNICKDCKLTSPFHNIFTNVNLGRFSDGEAKEFVCSDRSPINFNEEEIRIVLNLGRNHPLYLEIACFHVLEAKFKGIINENEIKNVFEKEIEQYKQEPSAKPEQEKTIPEKYSHEPVEIGKELEKFGDYFIVLLLSQPAGYYQKVVLETLDYLVNKKNMQGVYLASSKPYEIISKEIKKRGINLKNLSFIDCISGKSGENDFCAFVDDPTKLELINMHIKQQIEIGPRPKFLFIDDFSSLIVENDLRSIEEFSIKILNALQLSNTTGVIASIKEKTPKELIDRIVSRCDEVIYLD